jgi:hypothetical protein
MVFNDIFFGYNEILAQEEGLGDIHSLLSNGKFLFQFLLFPDRFSYMKSFEFNFFWIFEFRNTIR